jgi:hypothetical protein
MHLVMLVGIIQKASPHGLFKLMNISEHLVVNWLGLSDAPRVQGDMMRRNSTWACEVQRAEEDF